MVKAYLKWLMVTFIKARGCIEKCMVLGYSSMQIKINIMANGKMMQCMA